jgi:2-hydroxy-6-oxonona-2,4-dienedioate hydrolase
MVAAAERLAPNCRVYIPDFPGFGDSDKPERTLNLTELGDVLVAWMDEAGLERASLLGNSLGCQLGVDVAVRYPERVAKLVLQGPIIDPEARSVWGQAVRWLKNAPHESSSQAMIVFKDYRKCGLKRAWETFVYSLQDRIEEKLPFVEVPVLVVRGSKDPIAPQAWAEEVTRLLPKGRLKVVPGASHTLNQSAPLEFVRVIRPFLLSKGEAS